MRMGLVSELKRRNVIRMALLYAVSAWLIMQVAEVIIGLAGLPDWIGPALLGLLAVGFPIAIVLSWFFELTPEGIALESELDRTESAKRISGRGLDAIVISLLAAAVILFAYDKWWPRGQNEPSIVVLPFVNMSADPEQEYFSDGIAEELLNLLTQIPDLRVISRTSAFSYKGKDVDIPTVAGQLNVSHVLEGSVRKVGNQVRISAQLIEAQTDTHLWSRTYDRTLDDIFAIQDEIAASVVQKLKIMLIEDAPTTRATDPQAYALVLQARYLRQRVTPESLQKSVELYKQALEIDDEYAPAWAGLAVSYTNQADQRLRPAGDGYALARLAANRALSINPTYASAHRILGWIASSLDRDLVATARHYELALATEPATSASISVAASMAHSLGRLEQAIALGEYAVEHDPVSPVINGNLGLYYRDGGQLDESIDSFRTVLALSPGYIGAQHHIGTALLLQGQPDAALDAMERETAESWQLGGLAMAHHALGQSAEAEAALSEFIDKYAATSAYKIAIVHAFMGQADRAFDWLQRAVTDNDPGLDEVATDPLLANIHADPRWPPFLESIGKSPEQLAAIEFEVALPQ